MRALLRYFFRRIKYYRTTPFDIKHDDLFLVEYPKSGVTWLTFLLANIIQQKSETNFNVNFFNFTQFVTDISYSKHINSPKNYLSYRVIKSHANYNPFYNHVIFIIRNPFNVMMSYYSYLTNLNIIDMNFENFLRNKKYGIDNWILHTKSWLKRKSSENRLSIIRYEDIKNNTFKSMSNLVQILGWKIDNKIIENAVKLSSFEEMKLLEKKYSENNCSYNPIFVRKGQTGTKNIQEDDFNYIYKKAKDLINEFWSDIDFKQIISN